MTKLKAKISKMDLIIWRCKPFHCIFIFSYIQTIKKKLQIKQQLYITSTVSLKDKEEEEGKDKEDEEESKDEEDEEEGKDKEDEEGKDEEDESFFL